MNIKVKSFFDRQIFQELGMSTTRTIELVRKLSNGKPLTEKTATELLDYVANQNGDLATKQDVENVKQDVKKDIENVKKDIRNVKTDLENKIENVKTDIENKIGNVKTDLENKIENVKQDVENKIELVKQDVEHVKQDVAGVKQDIKGVRTELRWLYGIGFVTLLTLILNLRSETKSEMRELRAAVEGLRTLIIERTESR